MGHNIACFRCGASLSALSLPFSRRDECPECQVHIHVCKMCRFFDATVPKQCQEDDAEEVTEKERANFCEWFVASDTAFDPVRKAEADAARQVLDSLFGDDESSPVPESSAVSEAEKLFK